MGLWMGSPQERIKGVMPTGKAPALQADFWGFNSPLLHLECDRTEPSDQSPVPHDYEEAGEEYGSLGDGGSYYRLKCKNCGRIAYSPMPD